MREFRFRRMRPVRLLSVSLLVVIHAGACAKEPAPIGFQGICREARPRAGIKPAQGDWLALIVRGYGDRATHDCTGQVIRWEARNRDCDVQSPALAPPSVRPLSESSVVERILPNDRMLVWVITHEFANGDGYGPVALVSMYPNRLAVEAIGPLRMRTSRVVLEEWHIQDQVAIVASGETCHAEDDPTTCARASLVLVRRGDRLLSPVITFPDGRCLDTPWVEHRRTADQPRPSGWTRHFEIQATISHDSRYLVIAENVVVSDADPGSPSTPPRTVRRIDTERFIHVAPDGSLVTRQSPLWPRVLPSAGSVELDTPR